MASVSHAGTISMAGLAMLTALCGPAVAQQGTEAQREACTPDAFRLCMSAMPDAGRVEGCLRSNGPRLSPACQAVFNPPQDPQTTGQIRDRGLRGQRDVQRQPQMDNGRRFDEQRADQPSVGRRDDDFDRFERQDTRPRQPQYDDD